MSTFIYVFILKTLTAGQIDTPVFRFCFLKLTECHCGAPYTINTRQHHTLFPDPKVSNKSTTDTLIQDNIEN